MKTLLAAISVATAVAGCAATTATPDPPQRFAADRIVTRGDSFAIRLNGEWIGMQMVSVVPVSGGFRFSETTTMPQMSQTTEVMLSERLEMRRVTQRGTRGEQEMRIDVEYLSGRASGTARTPGQNGMEDRAVDSAVPPGVIDDNVLAALLPALEWAEDTQHTLAVFQSGRNMLSEHRLRVAGSATVEVPAGRFEAFRIESAGGDVPLVFYVERSPPHRLVRIEVQGTGLDVVRL
ncbi:MAG TPA: hypothetical protein VK912_15315 [Longimicrobiales bacterium]|nr:hypothetical protein [Longimicrobiales bacterium]